MKGIIAVAKLKEYISRAEKMNNDFLLTKAEARVPDGLHYCGQCALRIHTMPFCGKWKMILQSVQNTFRKSRMSLNAAVENSKRISTNLIDLEDITEKQHYQSASQLSTIE